MAEHIRIVAQQYIGIIEQIVKIHSPGHHATVAIGSVDRIEFGAFGSRIGFHHIAAQRIVFRRDKCVLGTGNGRKHSRRLVDLIVKLHILYDSLDKRFTVGAVIDREIAFESYQFGIGAENTRKDRMKGTHPQFRSHSAAHKLLHTLAHLFGSLVRKGQSKNPPRLIAEAE